jgi:hypothetical protein
MATTISDTASGRWMPGVWRVHLQHWIPPGAQPWHYNGLLIYFSACGATCMRMPADRNEWRDRTTCPACLTHGNAVEPFFPAQPKTGLHRLNADR